jgi:leader peptidase (prepilin peptidase)/N-methyltransferase
MAAHSVGVESVPATAAAHRNDAPAPARGRIAAGLVVVLAALAFALLTPAHAIVGTLAIAALVALPVAGIERDEVPLTVVLAVTAALLLAQLLLFPGNALSCLIAGVLAAAALAAPRLVSREAVGVGDIQLAWLLGIALGWSAFAALATAFVCAFPFALLTVLRRGIGARRETLPFAAFMALGGVLVIFAGPISG